MGVDGWKELFCSCEVTWCIHSHDLVLAFRMLFGLMLSCIALQDSGKKKKKKKKKEPESVGHGAEPPRYGVIKRKVSDSE